MTQEEKIKDLEERIALMEADHSALVVDLEHWKKASAGAKGRNKQLAERIEHYRQLDLEDDGLYEETLARLEEKEKVIAGLQSQVGRKATIHHGRWLYVSNALETSFYLKNIHNQTTHRQS